MLSALKKPDKNPFIAKKQASVAKKLTSWKKGTALAEAEELAWYLLAAGRDKAARSIVDEIADNVVFAKNYNVWGPAADAICMAARLARVAKDTKRHKALIARIVEVPAYAASADRSFFEDVIARNVEQLEAAPTEKRAATACSYAADSLAAFVYFAETMRHGGFPYDTWLDREKLERSIDEGVRILKLRLPTS